jgi:hypothetical protein
MTVTMSTLKFLVQAFFPKTDFRARVRNQFCRPALSGLVFPHAQEAALIVWGAVVACLASLAGTLGLGPLDASALGSLPEIMLVVSLFTLICAAEATG